MQKNHRTTRGYGDKIFSTQIIFQYTGERCSPLHMLGGKDYFFLRFAHIAKPAPAAIIAAVTPAAAPVDGFVDESVL